MTVLICFLVLMFLCAVLPARSGHVRGFWSAACVVLLSLTAMVVRYLCMEKVTPDYTLFLSRWVQFFRDNGGFAGLQYSVGNYNIPYLYFLAAFSYLPVPDLYLIKLTSVLFDVILAYAAMELVSCFTKDSVRCLAAYFTVLFLPTVILNGALWGQCDSIYVSFAVLSYVYALRERPWLSVAMIALSFSFKLQAVFFMPVFFLFLCSGKIKWYHLAAFPVTYLLVILPAVLLGRPIQDALLLYLNQAGSVGSGANYNSPSLFAFLRDPSSIAMNAGIIAAFALILLTFAAVLLFRGHKDDKTLLTVAVFFAVGIPFLLPHMHDRYFFGADVLTVIYAFVFSWRFAMPCLASFASLLGYHAYLKGVYLLQMRYGSMALIAVLAALIIDLVFLLRTGSKAAVLPAADPKDTEADFPDLGEL